MTNFINNYLGKDGVDWFFPRNDNYFSVIMEMAKKDYELLPAADIVIFLESMNQPGEIFIVIEIVI